ncbi:hypothetical protein UK99_19330 [Frankia casuarinae]|nr:hypothetical protein UK99_19330 [Frankia casuarinae]
MVTVLGALVIPSTLFLSGCGQNSKQDNGGAVPVPRASIESPQSATPRPAPAGATSHVAVIAQTAVPTPPGGKF